MGFKKVNQRIWLTLKDSIFPAWSFEILIEILYGAIKKSNENVSSKAYQTHSTQGLADNEPMTQARHGFSPTQNTNFL